MSAKSLAVLEIMIFIFLAGLGMVLQKKFPKIWERIQLPINIAVSVISLIMIAFIILRTYQVVGSDETAAGKGMYTLTSMTNIALFAWTNYRIWSEWARKRKPDQ